MKASIQGKKVYVKENHSEWGVVAEQLGSDVYVAMYDDTKEVRLFERNEVVVLRDNK